MLRSMTGFGRARGAVSSLSVSITMRSVNHRYLEISIRSPESLWELDQEIRSHIAGRLHRGKVDVVVRTRSEEGNGPRVSVNEEAIRDLRKVAERIDGETGFSGNIETRHLLALPGVVELQVEERELDDEEKKQIRALVTEALDDLISVRDAEGASLAEELRSRLRVIEELWRAVENLQQNVVDEQLQLYRDRIEQISQAAGISIDQDRILQETVIMAEKWDIREELARIESHLTQMRALLDQPDEPVGKKLDFFSQELIREVNTIGSKSRSSTLRSRVVELKSEIERVREQVQNVE